MTNILRFAAVSIFLSRLRTPRSAPTLNPPLDINDYITPGDELVEREGTWGITPEALASVKAALARQAESADAGA